MLPVVHPRILDVARAVRLSRAAEKVASEEKYAMDADIVGFAKNLLPGEKSAEQWANLGLSLYNFGRTKKASFALLKDGMAKLATAGVVDEALDGLDTSNEDTAKLASQVRALNNQYAVTVMHDLLDREE